MVPWSSLALDLAEERKGWVLPAGGFWLVPEAFVKSCLWFSDKHTHTPSLLWVPLVLIGVLETWALCHAVRA